MQNLRYSHYFRTLITLADLGILVGMLWFFSGEQIRSSELWISVVLLLTFFWLILGARTGIYAVSRLMTFTKFLERLVIHLLFFAFGILLLSRVMANQTFAAMAPRFAAILCVFFIIFKSLVFFALKWYRRLGYNHRNIMFWRSGEASRSLKKILERRRDYGFKIFEYKGDHDIQILKKFWQKNGIHTMYIPMEVFSQKRFNEELKDAAEACKVKISVIPDVLADNFTSYQLTYAETQPILEKARFPLESAANFILKRAFDILFSALFLVFVASWLFPILAILIKKDSKGSVFFKQKRYGFNDEVFVCYKFRTMRENGNGNSATTKMDDDRITKLGKWLRKNSLDELPQFFNVFLGDMSVVGPRPHMISVDDHYRTFINRYSIRNTVRPGITGLAQINGMRGDSGDMEVEMQRRVLTDAFYVKNWSITLDMVIILKTVILLIKGDKNAF